MQFETTDLLVTVLPQQSQTEDCGAKPEESDACDSGCTYIDGERVPRPSKQSEFFPDSSLELHRQELRKQLSVSQAANA